MNWTHQKVVEQGVIIDFRQRILRYDPRRYMIRISGTEKNPEIYVYSLVNP